MDRFFQSRVRIHSHATKPEEITQKAPKVKVGSCSVSSRVAKDLVENHTALHEGLLPKEFVCEKMGNVSVAKTLGRATEIQYRKSTPEGEFSYHHPWASQARPKIAVDRNLQLVIFSGRYETRRRGIEDRVTPGMKTSAYLKEPYVHTEKKPPSANRLITLGRLEWIEYKDGDRQRRLTFPESIAPTIAHDQRGNLHVLHGQYEITDRGVETMHRRRHRRSHRSMFAANDNPSRRHRRSRRGRRRNPFAFANPSTAMSRSRSSDSDRAMRMILNSVIVGGVAVGTAIGLNMLFQQSMFATWAPWVRALSKMGVGLLGGVGLAYALGGSAEKASPLAAIPAGVAVGGVFQGFTELYVLYVQTPAPAPILTTGTPAGQVFLPSGGVPYGYPTYNPASCGVAVGR